MAGGEFDWLPPLVRLAEYGGDEDAFIEALHRWFHRDFVAERPRLGGKPCGVRRRYRSDGREETFWHLVTDEHTGREWEISQARAERIRWPRAVIEAAGGDRVCSWKRRKEGETRMYITLEDFSYLVVLAEYADHCLLVTAYPVREGHGRTSLEREYKQWSR